MVTPILLLAAKLEDAAPKPIAKATALNTAVFFIITLLFWNVDVLEINIALHSAIDAILANNLLGICDQTHINENDYIKNSDL